MASDSAAAGAELSAAWRAECPPWWGMIGDDGISDGCSSFAATGASGALGATATGAGAIRVISGVSRSPARCPAQ